MNIKLLLPIFLVLFAPVYSFAQIDTLANRYKKDFDAFKQSIQKEHQQFKDKNDSIFIQFLKDSWSSFDVFYKTKTAPPKPVVQPSLPDIPPPVHDKLKKEPIDSSQLIHISSPAEKAIKPDIREAPAATGGIANSRLAFDFYGNPMAFPFPPFELPVNTTIKAESISSYFGQISSMPDLQGFIDFLRNQKNKYHLNDWGYLKLIRASSETIIREPAGQILYTWALLLKSGYNVKIGFSTNEVFLLIPYEQEIFNSFYITQNGVTYYILTNSTDSGTMPSITVHKADYPGNRKLSLSMKELPVFANSGTEREFSWQDKKFKVVSDKGLIDFFNEYPFCGFNVYFSCPLSATSLQSLDAFFLPLFKGLGETEKVSLLLRFLQRSFSYRTDKEQFGRERYLFANETLFYPYSDCEDRSVLFSRLVKHYTGLPCVAMNFPGHVSVAINFTGEINGDRIRFNNSDYLVCDPTYLNAGIGKLPPEYAESQFEIVTFE